MINSDDKFKGAFYNPDNKNLEGEVAFQSRILHIEGGLSDHFEKQLKKFTEPITYLVVPMVKAGRKRKAPRYFNKLNPNYIQRTFKYRIRVKLEYIAPVDRPNDELKTEFRTAFSVNFNPEIIDKIMGND